MGRNISRHSWSFIITFLFLTEESKWNIQFPHTRQWFWRREVRKQCRKLQVTVYREKTFNIFCKFRLKSCYIVMWAGWDRMECMLGWKAGVQWEHCQVMLIRWNIYFWMYFILPFLHPSPMFLRGLWSLKVGLCAKWREGRVDLKLSSSKKFLDRDEKCRVMWYFGEFRPGATPSGWGLVKHKDSWTRVCWQKSVSRTAAVGVCHGMQLQVKRIYLCNFAICCVCLLVSYVFPFSVRLCRSPGRVSCPDWQGISFIELQPC